MSNRNEERAFPSGPMGDSMTFEDGRTNWQYPGQPGMSLRDWFAGMAMRGLIEPDDITYLEGTPRRLAKVALVAYQVADAMMEAREAKQ